MKKTNYLLYLGMTVILLSFFSCEKDELVVNQPAEPEVESELAQMLAELSFDVLGLHKEWVKNPITGESAEYIMVEEDLMFTEDQIRSMVQQERLATEEQYRTTNLVTGLPRTITVLGYQGGTSTANLDNTMASALTMAVANYNDLNLGIKFTLSFGTATSGKDIVVCKTSGAGGGSAGFPTGGNPYNTVYIQSGTSAYGLDVTEHVLTHELGHCVGFRHTDYFNRAISCGGSAYNEGSAGVGAIHIPGTPSTSSIDMSSIMLSCFDAYETGEFSNYDKVALAYLYPGSTTPPPTGLYLTTSPTSVGFSVSGGSKSVAISSNVSWSVTDNVSWLSVSPASGSNNGTITLTANAQFSDPCFQTPYRYATVTITSAAGTKTISVSQAGTTTTFAAPYEPYPEPCL